MSVKNEIERKWLIDKDKIPFDLSPLPKKEMEQSYIAFSPTVRIRSENGEKFILCIKSKHSDMSREEYETEISKKDYEFLLTKKEGHTVKKTRYTFNFEGYNYEIDIFKDYLSPLAYLEIEFESEEKAKAFKSPNWTIKDVTNDKRYKNAYLAQNGITF